MNTKTLSSPTSLRYHELLLDHLGDPERSAAYLEAFLEESDSEPQLLVQALQDIIAACPEEKLSADQYEQVQMILSMLEASECKEIYAFLKLVKILGFDVQIQAIEHLD